MVIVIVVKKDVQGVCLGVTFHKKNNYLSDIVYSH